MGLCLEGLCLGGWGLCPGRDLSRGVSVQRCLCPEGSLSRDPCPGGESVSGGLCPGGSLSGRPPATVWLRAGGTHPTGMHSCYRSGTVNSKSFIGKVLLRIKQKFELNYAL